MELHTEKFHLFKAGEGMYRVQVSDRNLLRRVNALLRQYPADYVFKDGDEGVFTFPETNLFQVRLALKVKE